jgi:hypothetical protein
VEENKMIHKVMIEVEADKALSEYGDRHVILFDATKKRYYVQTREKFLSEQNQEIKKLRERIKESENKIKEYIKEADEKYRKFLETYTQVNEKVLELVRSVVAEG